ncbi:MAG: helix-turn-helix transcriptional regulator [Sulfitobacter sp.]|nr:helix-turn-helix transcriptional regulator [Sulfitobacter sp.]
MSKRAVNDRSQILPFPQATDTQFRIARCFALLNEWHAALTDHSDLCDVLSILVRQTGAQRITLYRHTSAKAQTVAVAKRFSCCTQLTVGRGSMLDYVAREKMRELALGSIWSLSALLEHMHDPDPGIMAEWDGASDIHDVSLVILDLSKDHVDAFEMVFDRPPVTNPDIPPALVTRALADAWALRAPGLIARIIGQSQRRLSRPARQRTDILGPDNPFGLTRSELRVCRLLVTGEKAKEIALQLGLSVPTVRSHLSSAYGKTGTGGQIELITLVNQSRSED